jgi:hypothetical protein
MTDRFDNSTAQIEMSELFSMSNTYAEIVGNAVTTFQRGVDPRRSDQLLCDDASPEWNLTLGFGVNSVSVRFGCK